MWRGIVLVGVAALAVAGPLATDAAVKAAEKCEVRFEGALGKMINLFGGGDESAKSAAVRGNRKAVMSSANGEIVDLDEGKVYGLDLKHKTYTVTTFEEMRRRMEEARKKAEAERQKQQGSADSRKEAPTSKQPPMKIEIEVEVKNTGRTKAINGFDTRETVIAITAHEKGKTLDQSGGLAVVSDMWLAPEIAALQEIAEFDQRYARKLANAMFVSSAPQDTATALATYPMLGDVLVRMRTENAKMDGSAIQTATTIDLIQSAEEMAQQRKRQAKEDSEIKPAKSVGGLLGGFAAKAVKKKVEGDESVKQRATIMTMTHEVLRVSSSVTAADLAIPEGFRQAR